MEVILAYPILSFVFIFQKMENDSILENDILSNIQIVLVEHLREPVPPHPISGHGRFDKPTHRTCV